MRFNHYYVEVKDEEGNGKSIVPHTGKGKNAYCEFLDKKQAQGFMVTLMNKNKHRSFRLVKKTTTYIPEEWMCMSPNNK